MVAGSKLHIDKLLSNISVKYRSPTYIAMDVFPEVPVIKESDLYRVYERNFRIPETRRANRGVANEHTIDFSTAAYLLERHSLKDYISDDDQDNFDIGDLRTDTTEELTDALLRRLEKTVADLFTTTSWSQNLSLTAAQQWNNTTTANPIVIFDTATSVVNMQSGFDPNFGIVTRQGLQAAKNNTLVLDRIKYTSREVTAAMLASLFGLPSLLVANASYDTSAQGTASNIASIWPNMAFVGYKPGSAGIKQPSSGYIFRKNKPMVKRYRDEDRECEVVEVNMHYQAKVVASLSGFLINAPVA